MDSELQATSEARKRHWDGTVYVGVTAVYHFSLVELATTEGIEASPPPESGRLRLVDILDSCQ